MREYNINDLRNIGLIGHSGVGKTSLAEALLYCSKRIDRLGKVEDGSTNSDYDLEEKKRKISINTSILQMQLSNCKINLLDTPGYFDFIGEAIKGVTGSDIALIVVCGVTGVQVGTEKSWKYCNAKNIPRAFFINKLDRENSNYNKVLKQLKDIFGNKVVPINYPLGKEDNFNGVVDVLINKNDLNNVSAEILEEIGKYKEEIMELVAENDEDLLNKYLENGILSDEEIYLGLINGIVSGDVVPVMCGSSTKCLGIESLIYNINKVFPSPNLIQNDFRRDNSLDNNYEEPFSAFVFKTIVDPFMGKLSIFKVITGEITNSTDVLNTSNGKIERINNLYYINGKNQISTCKIRKGDIGAISKLQNISTGDTICDVNANILYNNIKFPDPVLSMAVIPKTKGDEDKISSGLSKLLEEDNTFKIVRDTENAEILISGMGEMHLEVLGNRLKSKFGTDVILRLPKVPYRETIKGVIDIQGKHKKQSGGHGQYGDVKIKFEPRLDGEDELEFVDAVVGGSVPRNFIPAVEKGLRECIKHGVLAGYPVIGLKATLYDGSYHPVDSSEMAFKMAASIAYKKGLEQAKPILLEPIMDVNITVPDEYMGDVIGDINKKRGKVLGIDSKDGAQLIMAEIPLVESFRYATDLRSITQAKGTFTTHFKRYDEVPNSEINKIIEKNDLTD
ncbi:MAG: elongation factor G [Clostridium perfringens]|nr:elongation factor G [Clostridium perfringens]